MASERGVIPGRWSKHFVSGGVASEGSKKLKLGGSGSPGAVFPGTLSICSKVAHIHCGAQNVFAAI